MNMGPRERRADAAAAPSASEPMGDGFLPLIRSVRSVQPSDGWRPCREHGMKDEQSAGNGEPGGAGVDIYSVDT